MENIQGKVPTTSDYRSDGAQVKKISTVHQYNGTHINQLVSGKSGVLYSFVEIYSMVLYAVPQHETYAVTVTVRRDSLLITTLRWFVFVN